MDTDLTEKVMPWGVATIVHNLVQFSPVYELFQSHLKRWRVKNGVIACQHRKAEARLAEYLADAPNAGSGQPTDWPARTTFSTAPNKRRLVQIPPELDKKLERYRDPERLHLVRSLSKRQDFSTTESFVMLAELHDAAYRKSPLGYAIEYIVDATEAAGILEVGMSAVSLQNLATVVERVLDWIEALADSNSRSAPGKTLQQTIQSSRDKLTGLVNASCRHFFTPSNPEFIEREFEKLKVKFFATNEAKGQGSPPDQRLVSADQLGAFAGVGDRVIRNALRNADCRPCIQSIGKGNPHQWRYCDAIQSLKAVKSGKLRLVNWPDSAADVLSQKDSSKIPAKK
jgi:hypothetical protein